MQNIDREKILQKLSAVKPDLEKRYGLTRIGIFGSVARNEAKQYSDIDVVVEMQPDLLKRVSLKDELEELFGIEVDVVRYRHGMNVFLKNRIDSEAIYV